MGNKTDEILLPETKEVVVGTEKFEIGPLVRAKYKSLINVFVEVAMNLDEDKLDNLAKKENIKYLVNVISDKALINLYEATLDREKEWINNNMIIAQEIDLLAKIIEVNDVEQIIENFTQAIKKKQIQTTMNVFQNTKQ